ncbi:OmpH family outer membrane protein [Sphingorhabdus contaminans]|uniref:OmpH family outer membrane protein n=1 Tax=Sphingorhabdus contaminans TaxID=1343899 RepID=A0A553WA82_9SPHN|nr:OmpH family outer membrane protein [Sphingorhabdus contaminans]TSB01604.1 OmpH family outer membrane protein [Sphingorhabdus contaminans]
MHRIVRALVWTSLFVSNAPILAQTAEAPRNVAIADMQEAVARSSAYTAAIAQIKTTYASQITQAETRSKLLSAELQPLFAAYQAAAKAPNPNEATLSKQLNDLQKREQAARDEIAKLSAPIDRANAYAQEQISARLEDAVNAAMSKRQVGLLLQPQAAIKSTATFDLTSDISSELNALLPSVSITPPANWQPGKGDSSQNAGQEAVR